MALDRARVTLARFLGLSRNGGADEEAAIRTCIKHLAKMPDDCQQAIAKDPETALQGISPRENSPSYLAVLNILLNAPTSDRGIGEAEIRDKIVRFISDFDTSQIRLVPAALFSLLAWIERGTLFPPATSIRLLVTVIIKLDPTGSEFSSIHLMLAKLAYDSNCIKPALPVINRDIVFLADSKAQARKTAAQNKSATGALTLPLTNLSLLEYNLTCGLIHMSRRDWAKAQKALEAVIAHPTQEKALSKLMVEAYKKWVFVGLLDKGEMPSVPSQISFFVQAAFKHFGYEYLKLADLYTSSDAAQFKSSIEANQQLWEDDGNALLADEVRRSYQRWQILNLRRVYSNVPMSVIRTATISAESGEPFATDEAAQSLVRQMIRDGMLRGRISTNTAGEPYLVFIDDNELIEEDDFARQTKSASETIKFLGQRYQEVNSQLSHSKEYVRHLAKDQRRTDKADPGVEFDAAVEDEDLMTGIQRGP